MALPESAHKRNFHWCSLQWTSYISALWYFLMTFHLTSVKKEYFPLFLEDEFQYIISPSQAISSFSMTLLFSVSVLHLGCLSVYHWDSRNTICSMCDHSSHHINPSWWRGRKSLKQWIITLLIWLITQENLIGYHHHGSFKSYMSFINRLSTKPVLPTDRDRPDSEWESIRHMVH